MVAAEGGDQPGEARFGQGQAGLALRTQLGQQNVGGPAQRILGTAEDTFGSFPERRREPVDMQFAEEELRNILRVIDMGVGPAGHLQAIQGIEAGQVVTQRPEDAGEGLLPRRNAAGGALGEANGAQGAVVEHHLAPDLAPVGDIGPAGWRALHQIVEQQNVHGHGHHRTGDDVARLRDQRRRDVQHVDDGGGLRGAQSRADQTKQLAFMRNRHGLFQSALGR